MDRCNKKLGCTKLTLSNHLIISGTLFSNLGGEWRMLGKGECPRCGKEQGGIYRCMDCGAKYCVNCPSPKYQPNQSPLSQCPECGSNSAYPMVFEDGEWR